MRLVSPLPMRWNGLKAPNGWQLQHSRFVYVADLPTWCFPQDRANIQHLICDTKMYRGWLKAQIVEKQITAVQLETLANKIIICWCDPDRQCVADHIVDAVRWMRGESNGFFTEATALDRRCVSASASERASPR